MALQHGRSLSFPSSSHPVVSQFDDNLSRLRSSEATCSSLSSFNAKINGLRNLYESIDDLLLLSHIQQIVSEECVDDYIKLLDACSSVKDLISLAKQDLRDLLSAVRRKDVQGINAYLASRKKSKKMIQKSLKNLKRSASATSENASILKDAESVAISILESLLSYVLGHESKRSLLSKLIHSKKVSDVENEFNKVESFLQLNQESELVNHIKEMDSDIQVVEEDLKSIFRQLIKTRFDDNLSRLRSSEDAFSSLSSINATISGLGNLYESIDDLLSLPHIQQIVSEECIDDFIKLLDACSCVKDLISLAKQDLRDLLSAVRRKDARGINAYIYSRRNSKKMIQKCLKKLRVLRRNASATSENASMLKDAESVSISMLGSLLSYVCGMKMQERKSSWSLVSKLMHSKKVFDDENEFNKVDSFLQLSQENELVNHIKKWTQAFKLLKKNSNSYTGS
ncbi:hypothetical protein SASPL_129017 [Salvia splendens]|uniref:Uncharacterized protein n=1 Tax=Salvia splendens TaxID=180675 RepID=A0A8X8XDR0_SALSN|nr:hypothetical protein SASPL_129017 [Salvia splendens]